MNADILIIIGTTTLVIGIVTGIYLGQGRARSMGFGGALGWGIFWWLCGSFQAIIGLL